MTRKPFVRRLDQAETAQRRVWRERFQTAMFEGEPVRLTLEEYSQLLDLTRTTPDSSLNADEIIPFKSVPIVITDSEEDT